LAGEVVEGLGRKGPFFFGEPGLDGFWGPLILNPFFEPQFGGGT